ncbi:MAG: LysR family transcriptional regulator [Clostridiales Family XIII bacterium]|nr:LysR family transcriptional regulator [Clostridiales Family XIII bacterium]
MKHYNILDVSMYQIQLFLAVAEDRSFSRAALRMNLTQPALSKRIAALEDIVGAELFDREKRPVALTDVGGALLEKWKAIARQFELSVDEARCLSARKRTRLVVGIVDSSRQIPSFHLAGKQLARGFPGIGFSWDYVVYSRWREKLNSGELDIMFTLRMEEPNFTDDLSYEPVIVCPKLVCMLKSNPLSAKESITYEDLRTQKFVVNSPLAMPMHYVFIRENTLRHGFEPKIARYSKSTSGLISCLENDDEVVVCDMFLRDVDSEFLKVFELPDTFSGLDAVWLADNGNPYIRPYIDLLKVLLEQYRHLLGYYSPATSVLPISEPGCDNCLPHVPSSTLREPKSPPEPDLDKTDAACE